VLSPLTRTFQTITPYIQKKYGKDFDTIKNTYQEIQHIYQDLRKKQEIQSYLQNSSTQKLFSIGENIYMDFRITDIIIPELQDKTWINDLTTSKATNEKLTPL
jgi:hypothetical protein